MNRSPYPITFGYCYPRRNRPRSKIYFLLRSLYMFNYYKDDNTIYLSLIALDSDIELNYIIKKDIKSNDK